MRSYMVVAVAVFAFACGKKDENKASTKSAEGPAAPAAAPATGSAEATPSAAPAVNAEPVDVCALLPKDKAEAAVGPITGDYKPTMPASGSMLGDCGGMGAKGMASISARPASEFDQTVAMAKDAKELPGIGEKAFMSKYGVMLKLSGKPFFLQVMVMDPAKAALDEASTTALAKAVADNAK